MSIQAFASLPLHDAILGQLEYLWQQKLCRIQVSAFTEAGKKARPHQLEFQGVTYVSLSHGEPWGPSISILGGTQIDGKYQLQMQSGDHIEVMANAFSFVAL
jgi:hypothetical protein